MIETVNHTVSVKIADKNAPVENRKSSVPGPAGAPDRQQHPVPEKSALHIDTLTVSGEIAGNAVYDIRDIRRDRSPRAPSQAEPRLTRLRGETVTKKMVEIPLATGRKSLSVYRKAE